MRRAELVLQRVAVEDGAHEAPDLSARFGRRVGRAIRVEAALDVTSDATADEILALRGERFLPRGQAIELVEAAIDEHFLKCTAMTPDCLTPVIRAALRGNS